MKPAFQILANGRDITIAINDRLIDLTITDERGMQSDSIEIRLDDRDSSLAILPTNAEIYCSLGRVTNEDGLQLIAIGKYIVDDIEVSGPPDTYTIRAKAVDFGQTLKQQKTRAWDNVSIGAIIAKIASEHGLKAAVDPVLAAIVIPHISQTEESDLHLLARMSKEHDAVAKPVDGYLLYTQKGKAISVSGQDIAAVVIDKTQCSDWSFTIADHSKYKSVIAEWQDTGSAVRVAEKIGNGEPTYTIKGVKKTKQDALHSAQSKFRALKRGTSTGSLTVSGGAVNVSADTPIHLIGWRADVSQRWITTKVRHKLSRSGLSTMIDFETPKISD